MADNLTTFLQCQLMFKPAAADETMIDALITAASVRANKYTSRKLLARDLVEYYDGDGTNVIFLDNYPINSIASVYQDSDRIFPEPPVDSDDYIYYATNRKLVGLSNWYRGIQTIKITYNAGYVTVPSDLEQGVLILISVMYKNYKDHRYGVTSVGIDDQRIAYETTVPKIVKELWDPYRKKIIL